MVRSDFLDEILLSAQPRKDEAGWFSNFTFGLVMNLDVIVLANLYR